MQNTVEFCKILEIHEHQYNHTKWLTCCQFCIILKNPVLSVELTHDQIHEWWTLPGSPRPVDVWQPAEVTNDQIQTLWFMAGFP